MSLVLRFVDSDFNIREDFIQFIYCSEGVKGKDLFNVLLNCVSNLNLDIKNCRGQGYDGASSVSGYINGLSAQVLNINSKALYTHCHSHRLNLSFCESFVTTRVFDFTLPVTRLLQSKTIDILDGLHLITALKNTFISIRNDIDSFHNNCYKAACLLSKSVSDYFKRAVTIPLIDHVSTSISTRFKSETVTAYKGLSIIPFNIISFLKRPKTQLCWRKQFETFCDFYIDDFPNISALNGELVLWEKYWESFSGTIPDNISLTLKSISFPGFENVKIALRIFGTLPVTSCECERSFSVMRR
nr:uncharacterized protein LOC124814676 [Hydra vulgaris]